MSLKKILRETEKIKNTIYQTLKTEITLLDGDLSNYELRQMIFAIFEKVLGYEIQWADTETHGKNIILVTTEFGEAAINITGLMESLKEIGKEHFE